MHEIRPLTALLMAIMKCVVSREQRKNYKMTAHQKVFLIVVFFFSFFFFLVPFTFRLCEHRVLVTCLCRDRPNEVDNSELDSVVESVGLKGSRHLLSGNFEASTVLTRTKV